MNKFKIYMFLCLVSVIVNCLSVSYVDVSLSNGVWSVINFPLQGLAMFMFGVVMGYLFGFIEFQDVNSSKQVGDKE